MQKPIIQKKRKMQDFESASNYNKNKKRNTEKEDTGELQSHEIILTEKQKENGCVILTGKYYAEPIDYTDLPEWLIKDRNGKAPKDMLTTNLLFYNSQYETIGTVLDKIGKEATELNDLEIVVQDKFCRDYNTLFGKSFFSEKKGEEGNVFYLNFKVGKYTEFMDYQGHLIPRDDLVQVITEKKNQNKVSNQPNQYTIHFNYSKIRCYRRPNDDEVYTALQCNLLKVFIK